LNKKKSTSFIKIKIHFNLESFLAFIFNLLCKKQRIFVDNQMYPNIGFTLDILAETSISNAEIRILHDELRAIGGEPISALLPSSRWCSFPSGANDPLRPSKKIISDKNCDAETQAGRLH
jgi:hypothetical protein